MRKVYCDRCKKLIKNGVESYHFCKDEPLKDYIVDIRKLIIDKENPDISTYSNYYDFCDKCYDQLITVVSDFMDVKKK